ncbi:uncharacterized protein LOC126898679 [Daktulosphaira vitifoliae]|uniref:uncharacterized protein LOC126898679 n=1 Tax=Daktulosphaira vitifoliae TaxID=58002 RepID=UPI0021A9F3FC|nr:uncharacterized protein LOC126898679 [Daktulosphaira vitifoliae]XP_050528918.1 uncharacterized protein LOC126898679 [Daktulosphaira vitifoliae]XP_050528919.1 uncharacterized protein LOC126898679 [Daktulosphaira vitifoliae]XP_050528920.1 uncharacterized protein LOC126898679 [Daktulosphaira vitifoliae]
MSGDNKQSVNGHGMVSIELLPLEIIANIVSYLDVADIVSLSCVNRLWRTVFMNQNVIWKRVCIELDLCDDTEYGGGNCPYTDDWLPGHGPTFLNKTVSASPRYVVLMSTKTFGQPCRWWRVYNRYNIVLHNLISDNYSIVTVPYPSRPVKTHWCDGNYEVMVGCRQCFLPVLIMLVDGSASEFKHVPLDTPDTFNRLFAHYSTENSPKVMGNDNFLVLEIHSVVFVFEIDNSQHFQFRYAKTVGKQDCNVSAISCDINTNSNNNTHIIGASTTATENRPSNCHIQEPFEIPDKQFLQAHADSRIALYGDKLVVVHPKKNMLFLIDLNSGQVYKQLEYTAVDCYVDCLSFYENLILLGLGTRETPNFFIVPQFFNQRNLVVIYDIATDQRHEIEIPGPITRFRCNHALVAVETPISYSSAFIRRPDFSVFFINCYSFALSPSGKYIFYIGSKTHYRNRHDNNNINGGNGVNNNNEVNHENHFNGILSNNNTMIFSQSLYKSSVVQPSTWIDIELTTGITRFSCLEAINDRFVVLNALSPSRSLEVFDTKNQVVVKSLAKHKDHKLRYVGKRFLVTNNQREVTLIGYG